MATPVPTAQVIALRVHTLRVKAGLSQSQLAERATVSPLTVANIEKARHSSTIDSVEKVALALGVNIAQLAETP